MDLQIPLEETTTNRTRENVSNKGDTITIHIINRYLIHKQACKWWQKLILYDDTDDPVMSL